MDIKLVVDGKDIEMNQFVRKFIGNTVLGMVSSLNDIAGPKTIVIEVKVEEDE